jgi:hypothetical protein
MNKNTFAILQLYFQNTSMGFSRQRQRGRRMQRLPPLDSGPLSSFTEAPIRQAVTSPSGRITPLCHQHFRPSTSTVTESQGGASVTSLLASWSVRPSTEQQKTLVNPLVQRSTNHGPFYSHRPVGILHQMESPGW